VIDVITARATRAHYERNKNHMITITNNTYRLIAAIGFGLVWGGGAAAAERVKPPAVSVCQNEICLTSEPTKKGHGKRQR
jgi:hypothetical protein